MQDHGVQIAGADADEREREPLLRPRRRADTRQPRPVGGAVPQRAALARGGQHRAAVRLRRARDVDPGRPRRLGHDAVRDTAGGETDRERVRSRDRLVERDRAGGRDRHDPGGEAWRRPDRLDVHALAEPAGEQQVGAQRARLGQVHGERARRGPCDGRRQVGDLDRRVVARGVRHHREARPADPQALARERAPEREAGFQPAAVAEVDDGLHGALEHVRVAAAHVDAELALGLDPGCREAALGRPRPLHEQPRPVALGERPPLLVEQRIGRVEVRGLHAVGRGRHGAGGDVDLARRRPLAEPPEHVDPAHAPGGRARREAALEPAPRHVRAGVSARAAVRERGRRLAGVAHLERVRRGGRAAGVHAHGPAGVVQRTRRLPVEPDDARRPVDGPVRV